MKKVYERPEAKIVCFQSLDRIALLEHDVEAYSDDSAKDPSMGVIEGGRD